ncbi:hypothetical protein HQQ94_05400 [Shewanella sp. VB17]|uniref:hypothetical protein n=1 Tax=Shewanella sp. VB17 TaxID=2739432 RepID=UPI001C25FBD3|nr:hypothetical protein [Shewanella sp. VB17]NRD72692.1 hypothetical protein [Shewanella sp. VB17]
MSDQLKLVITRQGLDECISAKSKGISLNLKWVSAGDTAYTPNPDQTRLKNEIQRVEFGEYKNMGRNQLQAVGKFSGPQEYPIRELGFWLDNGTLLGVISAPGTTLNYKPKDGHCIQPITLDLSTLPSDSVTVVVGTENLNILIDEEFTKMATAQVDMMHRQMLHDFRITDKANRAEVYDKLTADARYLLKSAKSVDAERLDGKSADFYAKQAVLETINQELSSVIVQFIQMATAQVDSMHRQMLQDFQLSDKANSAEVHSKLIADARFASKTEFSNIIRQLTAAYNRGANLINGV